MTVIQEIMEYANPLFDVVGASRFSDTESLLILGLGSMSERNLDEFGELDGQFQLYGFEKYVSTRLKSVIKFIRGKGFSAVSLGRYGYPLEGEVNLKEKAIGAGLGKRGKSAIVLHPKYGTRLRFMAISTDAPSESTSSSPSEEESPFCNNCTICIDACPVNALEPYCMPDVSICLSNTDIMSDENGRHILCDICLCRCPAYLST